MQSFTHTVLRSTGLTEAQSSDTKAYFGNVTVYSRNVMRAEAALSGALA
jgi:hypothetical protein